ncbi:MAG: WD40 repeat domain-containing protein [Deltaproteobacteria bacterium]|nr:WD40 repeat domain-containing protein [Deltaproteobacteria bacterium]
MDGKIISWNIKTMQPEKVLVRPFGRYSKFEISPVGTTLVYLKGRELKLFDYETLRDVGVLYGNTVDRIVYLMGGKYLAAGVYVWDVNEKKIISELYKWGFLMSEVPTKDELIFSGYDFLDIVDIKSKTEIRRIRIESKWDTTIQGICQVIIESDGKRGYALSDSGILGIFNVETGEVTARIKTYPGKIMMDEKKRRLYKITRRAGITSEDKYINQKYALIDMSYEFEVYDMDSAKLIDKGKWVVPKDTIEKMVTEDGTPAVGILDAVLSPDGKIIAVSSEGCTIRLFSSETFKPIGLLGEGCRVAPRPIEISG